MAKCYKSTIAQPNFNITGTSILSSSLAPTTNCAHSTYALKGNATVTANNPSNVTMTAVITLKGKLTPVSGRTLSSADKGHIHWGIKEVTSATLTTYSQDNCTISANTPMSATGDFSSVGASYTDIPTTIEFTVPTGTKTKYYQIYVWIDSGYEFTNTGTTVTDPMEGLTVDLTFSATSTLSVVSNIHYAYGNPTTSSPTDYTTIVNQGHNVFAVLYSDNTKGACAVVDGQLGCFKAGTSYVTSSQRYLKEFFASVGGTCTDDGDVNCATGAFDCDVDSNGSVECNGPDTEENCNVNAAGTVSCS